MGVYAKVFESGENVTGYRYISGRQVLDEVVISGRLITRYRNCTGQVYPEMSLGAGMFENLARKYPEADAFKLSVNGKDLSGGWQYAGFGENGGEYALNLNHESGISVKVCTDLTGTDFFALRLEITNNTKKAAAVTAVSPLAGYIWLHRGRIEKEVIGEGKPCFEIAYNHQKDWGKEGDFYFDPLEPGEFRFYSDYGRSGWTRPAFWLRDNHNGEVFVCEYAWSGNWQIKAAASEDGEYSRLSCEIGMLETEGEALRVLEPGETVATPSVHFGVFRCGDDEIVQKTHAYVRSFILPPLPKGVPLSEIEANHRGYLCDRESEEGIKADIDIAAETESEMYVVDAGWYGTKEPNQWGNNVGDWVAGPWMKNGFEPIPEYAHKKGMRFGLWVEIEAAGANSKLREEHPEWIAQRNGEPCAGGRALYLADPEVEKFCFDTICSLVDRYKLDMYRLDHNHCVGLGATRQNGGFRENTLWRYYEAFYRIFDKIRAKYPDLTLQNCAGGGGRLDWGALSRFHNTELSDWMRQPRSARILSGVTMSLPPEILLRTFGTEVPEWHMDGDLDSQIRISMICRPIYRGIAPSAEELTPYLKEKLLKYNRLYKSFFRPLLKDCLVYHHTPFQPVQTAAPMTILEYSSPAKSMGMIAVFTHSKPCENLNIKPRGLSREKKYKVSFDNSGESAVSTGLELMSEGFYISVGLCMSSELIMIKEV
jgi:alpha-galactosidase